MWYNDINMRNLESKGGFASLDRVEMKNSSANKNFRIVIETGGTKKGILSCTAASESLLMVTAVNIADKFYDSDKEEKL